VRPQVAEEGDGLQIWRVAANTLRGGPPVLGVGRGANNTLP
jgi:hypothetical protein